jgi:hypothetical protein
MATTPQQVPINIAIAPFPEGFQGDMDETFQQAVQLMTATMAGNFLTGLILPPGSTLPTTDQGPIAIGNVWYFWDPVSGQYLPQTVSSKIARNFVKNPIYQIQQTGSAFTLSGTGPTKTYDMVQPRTSVANVLAIAADVGPPASGDNDYCPAAIKYTVPSGATLVPTPAATDLLTHEHLIEGTDIAMIQGQALSLSFSVWTNVPGTYSYYITSTGRDASYVGQFTITTASAWTRIKVAGIPAIPTGVGTWNFGEGSTGMYIGIPMCVGTQWQSAAGNLNKWQPAFMAGTASNSNLCTVVNNQIKICGIKLEASPQVSYLSVPSFEQDYWECIRYYFTTFNYQSVTAGIWGLSLIGHATGAAFGSFMFPRRMAKIPTIAFNAASSITANALRNLTTNVDVTAFAAPSVGQKGLTFVGAITTPAGAKGDVFSAYITADARLS